MIHPCIWKDVKARCVWVGDCFVWQGANIDGHGVIKRGGRNHFVHRIAYEHVKGPIPKGLTIDHVRVRGCRHRGCCNVAHLEAVTIRVNNLRGDSPFAQNARKTHCQNGHPLTGDNLQPAALRQGKRICRTCYNAGCRVRIRRYRAEARQ